MMRFLPRRTISSVLLVISLGLILTVLAGLQYRWSSQISESVHERMHASLLTSMHQFRVQFNNELQHLGFLLQPDGSALMRRDWKSLAENCSAAMSASDGRLVRNVYLWVTGDNGSSQLLRLNQDAKIFEPAVWPPELGSVKPRYARFFVNPQRPSPDIRPFTWIMINRVPLLLQPLISFRPPPEGPGPGGRFIGFLMTELNLEVIKNDIFPELAKRHFQGPDGFIYQVAVLGGSGQREIVYRCDSSLSAEAFVRPDARIILIEREPLGPRSPEQRMDLPGGAMPLRPLIPFRPEPPPRRAGGIAPVLSDGESANWVLAAKHREGSLEIAVAKLQRRNLALSFGSLVLLAASMALIIVSARRAQRLARLQIDFVAGISHELRTPLAVICSAGDNLAEGAVADSNQSARKYGELIRSEGRKLAGMVEQILQFAGTQSGRRRYSLRPEQINRIVDAALEQAQPLITSAGFSVEKSLAPDIPPVNTNAAALSQAIQNLIQNALKYSGKSRWLGLRTEKALTGHGMEARIIIEDRGVGIDEEDLAHIFEPFYRGKAAVEGQVRGTGLGLFMAREALAAMRGSISVKTVPGESSAFIIHLPTLPVSNEGNLSDGSGGKGESAR